MKLLRPKEAAKKLGVSRQSLWRWCRDIPDFPKPVKLAPGTTAFMESELEKFIRSRQVQPEEEAR